MKKLRLKWETLKLRFAQWAVSKLAQKGSVSDGYHTFDELYEHRCRLYMELCYQVKFSTGKAVWCSIVHSDGTWFDGWFVLGINKEPGKQITYHLPMKMYHEAIQFAEIIPMAPEYDGHTSAQVLERIKELQ